MSKTSCKQAGPLQAIILLLPCTLAVMGTVVLAPVLPMLQDHFAGVPGARYWVPMILTVPAMVQVLFLPLAGVAADIFGRRKLLLIAMLLYAIVGVAPLALDRLTSILISRVVVGVLESFILTVSTTLIGDFFKGAARDKWLAYQTAIASVSAVCFIFLGGLLGIFGWRGPFVLYGSAALLLGAVALFTWEPEPESEPEEAAGPAPSTRFPFRKMLGICAITLFVSTMFFVVQLELPFGLRDHGVSDPVRIGTLTAIASIFVPIGSFVFMRLSRRLSVSALLFVELVILATGFVGMGLAPGFEGLVAAAALNQIGAGMSFPTLLTWAMRGLAYEWRGRGTGLWQGANATGQFLTPLVMTLVAGHVGGLFPAFVAVGIACAGAAVLAAFASMKRGIMAPPRSNLGLTV